MNAVWYEADDIPSRTGVERGSELLLTDGMRADVGTFIAEAQHIQRSTGLGYRRETRDVSWPLVGVEGVEESAVQHRLKAAIQTVEMKCVSRSELGFKPALSSFLAGDRQRCFSHVNAETGNPSEAR